MAINTHILPDDKFNSGFVRKCAKYGTTENRFISIPEGDEDPKFPVDEIDYVESHDDILEILNSEQIRRIYVHGLWSWRSNLLRRLNVSPPITWVLYGVGVYRRLPFYKIYETRTRAYKYFGREEMRLLDWARFIKKNRPRLTRYLRTRRTLQKLDSIAFWLRHDCERIRRFYQLDVDYIDFNYGLTPLPTNIQPTGIHEITSLLLGNSANTFNNHLDALYQLKSAEFDGRIVCPLSYSGGKEYTDKVIQVGQRLFGESFEPLRSYMDKSRYFELLDDLDAAYFYHRRQQAGGNIRYFLSRGKPVFLHPASPLLPYYRDLGVPTVYPADVFDMGFEVSPEQAHTAISALQNRHSEEARRERYHNLLTYGMPSGAAHVSTKSFD